MSETGAEAEQEETNPVPGRFGRLVRRVEEVFFGALIISMIVIGLVPILVRRLLPMGMTWAEPLSRHMVLWIALLGAGAATQERHHIAVDAVTHFLSRRWQLTVRGFTECLGAVVCGVLAWVSVAFVRGIAEFEGTSVAFLSVREWWLTLALPLGFGLLALRLATAAFVDAIAAWRTGGEGAP